MNHVAHLVRWDLRRLRLLLAIWIVIVIAQGALTGLRPLTAADASLRESIAVMASLLWMTMALLGFAMVSFVIHGHPTVGSDAFWMTRAIPPRSLLASKLVLVALALVVLPAIVDAALMIVHRMPAATTAGVVAQSVSIRAVLALLLTIGAVMTLNLPRFALLCGSVLLTCAAAFGLFVAIATARLQDDWPVRTARNDDDPTGLVVFNAVFVLAALVALAVQYRTRLRRRSVTAFTLGLVIAGIIASAWPIPFLTPRLEVPAWAHDSGALIVTVDPRTISTKAQHLFGPTRGGAWSTVNGRVNISGVAPGWMATMSVREATIELPGKVTLIRPVGWTSSFLIAGSGYLQPERIIRDLLNVDRVGGARPDDPTPSSLPALFLIRERELAQYAPARGQYHANLDVHLTRYEVDGTMPLAIGAVYQNGAYRLVIDGITEHEGDVVIVVRESRASSMWERRPWSRYTFYLRHRERGEAVVASDYELRGGFSLWRILPIGEFSVGTAQGSGFFTRGLALNAPPRYDSRANTIDVDEQWLAGAELVIVRQTEEGSVERTIDIADFPLGQ